MSYAPEYIINQIKGIEDNELVINLCNNIILDLSNPQKQSVFNYHENDLCASILYIAYRKAKMPKTIREVLNINESKFQDVSPFQVGKIYKKIKRILNMKYCKNASITNNSCISLSSAREFIRLWCRELKTSEEVLKKAMELNNQVDGLNLSRNPATIACSIIYLSGVLNNEKISQRNLSKLSGISDVSLRSGYKYISKRLNIGLSKCQN